jgi:hypothetical protein
MSVNLKIGFSNNFITNSSYTKFLGVAMNNTLSSNYRIDLIMKKLSKACYIIRNAKTNMSVSSLKVTCYAFFHSVMSYGIIFWGNWSHSCIIFRIQKKAIRIMEGRGNRVLFRNLFKKLWILPSDITIYVVSINVCGSKQKSFPNKQWKSQFRH